MFEPSLCGKAEGRAHALLAPACIAVLMAGIPVRCRGSSIRSDLGGTRARVKRRLTALRWGLAHRRGSNACS